MCVSGMALISSYGDRNMGFMFEATYVTALTGPRNSCRILWLIQPQMTWGVTCNLSAHTDRCHITACHMKPSLHGGMLLSPTLQKQSQKPESLVQLTGMTATRHDV